MSIKHLTLVAAFALTAPAYAITVNVTDFSFGFASTVPITSGPAGAPTNPLAGQVRGTYSDGPAASAFRSFGVTEAVSETSFTAYCAELTQDLGFNITYTDYSWETGLDHFGATKLTALSKLFTAAEGLVHDAATSAAMQAGIWEILYETGTVYNLSSGAFKIDVPSGDESAFAAMNAILGNLDEGYQALYSINVLTSGTNQDLLVGTIPEPGTWALFGAGLGLLGFIARRRKR
jgi:hypothetical protein